MAMTVAVLSILVAGCGSTHHASASKTTASTATSAAAPAETTAAPTVPLIDHVHWGSTDKGAQLQVFPTEAGRTDKSDAAPARAWAEILADAPNANTPGMYDQFLCHWDFARLVEPDKPSWNLEPWRPAVGYQATVAASCNPGGPES